MHADRAGFVRGRWGEAGTNIDGLCVASLVLALAWEFSYCAFLIEKTMLAVPAACLPPHLNEAWPGLAQPVVDAHAAHPAAAIKETSGFYSHSPSMACGKGRSMPGHSPSSGWGELAWQAATRPSPRCTAAPQPAPSRRWLVFAPEAARLGLFQAQQSHKVASVDVPGLQGAEAGTVRHAAQTTARQASRPALPAPCLDASASFPAKTRNPKASQQQQQQRVLRGVVVCA